MDTGGGGWWIVVEVAMEVDDGRGGGGVSSIPGRHTAMRLLLSAGCLCTAATCGLFTGFGASCC